MAGDATQLSDSWRPQIEAALRQQLRRLDQAPRSLQDAVAYSLMTPGKRLRPILVLLGAEAAGGDVEAALPAACAVEMVHAYSLVHDDLPAMDDDDLRRGQPTCHKKFGEAMAILVGDSLLTLAFEVLADYPPRTAARCSRELAQRAGGAGMVGGQVEDLTWDGKIPGAALPRTLGDLQRLHARKTGALFHASLKLGLIVAQAERPEGLDPDLERAFETYARCFGQVFQITDDVLDVAGETGATGKRVGKDAGRGKLTYPGFLGLEESRLRADTLGREAIQAVQPLGAVGSALSDLVQRVLSRDR